MTENERNSIKVGRGQRRRGAGAGERTPDADEVCGYGTGLADWESGEFISNSSVLKRERGMGVP